jgi:hypothetical protein
MKRQNESKPTEGENDKPLEVQESVPRSIGKQEKLKKIIKRHPQRDTVRVDSVEVDEPRGE